MSAADLAEAAEWAPVAMFRTAADGATTWVNQSWCALCGSERALALGTGWQAAIHPTEREAVVLALGAGRPCERAARLLRPDGSTVRVLVQVGPLPGGGVVGVATPLAAVDDRADWRLIIERSPLGVAITRQGLLLYVNPAYARIFGHPDVAALVGASFLDQVAPEQRAWVADRLRRREAGEALATSYDVIGLRRDGVRFPYRVDLARIERPDGASTLAYITDISQQMRAEQALRESEQRFAAFMDNSPFIAFLKDAAGRFVFANREYLKQFSVTLDRLVGRSVHDLFPPVVAARLAEKDLQVLASDRAIESEELVPDYQGRGPRPWLVIKFPVRDASGRRYIGSIGIDVSERKRLIERQERLAHLIEATTDFVATAGIDGSCLFVNRAGRQLVGIGLDEDVQALAIPDFHPPWAMRVLVDEGIPAALRDGTWSGEIALRHRDGHEIPVSQVVIAHRAADGTVPTLSTISRDISSAKRVERALRESEARLQAAFASFPAELLVTDREGQVVLQNQRCLALWGDLTHGGPEPWAVAPDLLAAWRESRDRALTGEVVATEVEVGHHAQRRVIAGVIAPIRVAGEIVGLIASSNDITERRGLEERLRQAQKMEAVGKLAGGIAHDFNNLLTAILGFGGMLADRHPPGDPSRPAIDQVLRGAERAAELTGKLLAFSRKQVLVLRPLDLNRVIGDLDAMLRRIIGEHLAIDLALAPGLYPVRADLAQCEQVVMNLVVNARDAMPGGGRIAITTSNRGAGADLPGPGEWVELVVTDTGAGIPAEVMPHLFEPFYTTKQLTGGTGLGLSTVYAIVTGVGGRISVHNRAGGGAGFVIHLPRCAEVAEEPAAASAPVLRCGRETILVVEDEVQVRELIAEMLRCEGYDVIATSDGVSALAAIAALDRPIHLLLSDVVMPRMTGRDLAERVSASHPGLHTLLISGYTADIIDASTAPGFAFLAKPFSAAQLLGKVREVLDCAPIRSAGRPPD